MAFDRNEVQAYVRDAARRRGIDPDTALRVIKQESGFNPMATNLSPKEKSYGLMQLNTQGGLGVHALEKGINIRDPNTWRQQVDFGLDVVAKDGWRQWYGARDVGIGRWDGIGGRPAGGASPLQQAVADRENVASSTNGPAKSGVDLGGQPTGGTGGSVAGPTVNIGMKPERSTALYDAMLASGMTNGAKSANIGEAVSNLAQVWAATRGKTKAEAENASELQKALAGAGLDPSYALAAQLNGGRDGAAQAILAQQQDRTQAANRSQARDDMLEQRAYQQGQDEMANDRAERGLAIQETVAARKGDGFRMLTADEAKDRGLPPGSYQVGSDGKIDEVGKGGQTINVNGQSNKFREKADERMVKRFGDIADGQTAAANTAQTIPVMRELLTQAPTGPLAGRLAERFPGFSTAGDAFKATINQIAPTLRIPGSGAMSDRDMDVLMGSFPKLSNDPNANGLIMGLFEKKAQLNLQRADIANKALRGEIDAAAADQQLAEFDRMPLLDDAMRATLTGQPQQPQQPMAGGVPVGGLVPGSDAGRTEAAPVRRARNPQTGQVLELRNGQWVPAQ